MKMKIMFMTLVLALMLMSGSALKCYQCPLNNTGKCTPKNEDCKAGVDACFSGEISYRDIASYAYKQCMAMSACLSRQSRRDYKNVKCCQTDFCN